MVHQGSNAGIKLIVFVNLLLLQSTNLKKYDLEKRNTLIKLKFWHFWTIMTDKKFNFLLNNYSTRNKQTLRKDLKQETMSPIVERSCLRIRKNIETSAVLRQYRTVKFPA